MAQRAEIAQNTRQKPVYCAEEPPNWHILTLRISGHTARLDHVATREAVSWQTEKV